MLMGLKDFFNKFVTKNSRGITRDSLYSGLYTRWESGTSPEDSLDTLLYMFQNDPEINTAVTVRVNAILSSGFTIETKSQSTQQKALSKLKKLGFNKKLIRKILYNLILYEHCFIEIYKENDVPKDLNVLETTDMEIVHDEHGNIKEYVQVASSGDIVHFPKDDIIYIKMSDITSSVWGVPRLKTLYKSVSIKGYIEQFLLSLSSRFSWRNYIRFSNMSDDEIKDSLGYLNHISEDPNQPFVLKAKDGDFSTEPMRDPKEVEYFLGLLNYLRQQIFMLLRVPPIVVGLPDNSNRSNSDAQIKSFNIDNQSVRDIVQESFNDELFPKLGLSYAKFSWNPIDKRNEKDDVEIAERLINMGANKDRVEEFLRNTGLELPKGKLFTNDVPVKKSEDMFPSRQRKPENQTSQNIGTGEDSTTREDQIVTKSYWYYDALNED